MADSYLIIDGVVVPYSGGRKCNDTDAWRDATPLELQMQEQLAEHERTIAAQEDEIKALRELVEKLRADRDSWEQQASDRAADWHAEHLRAERLAEALRDLLDQLEGVGIYIPGEDSGQWAGAEGLSFAQAEAALAQE